jgi:hypothetical protein
MKNVEDLDVFKPAPSIGSQNLHGEQDVSNGEDF